MKEVGLDFQTRKSAISFENIKNTHFTGAGLKPEGAISPGANVIAGC